MQRNIDLYVNFRHLNIVFSKILDKNSLPEFKGTTSSLSLFVRLNSTKHILMQTTELGTVRDQIQ